MTDRAAEHVSRRISDNDPWYTSDQFLEQWGNPSMRAVIQGRWARWAVALDLWLGGRAPDRPLHVLDAGCGDGINLQWLRDELAQRGLASSLVGMDYNALRLSRVAQRYAHISPILGDLGAIPVQSDAFDLVLCNHALEHVRDDVRVLKELARIMRPGGMLILGVPNEGCLMARLRNSVIQPSIGATTDHVHFYTGGLLVPRMQQAGLSLLKLEREGFFMPHMSLNMWLGGRAGGRSILDGLAKLFPGQAAGLIAFATKPVSQDGPGREER